MQYSSYNQPVFEQREPRRSVDFGWVSEAFDLFKQQAATWIIAALVLGITYFILSMLTNYVMQKITPNPTMGAPTMAQFLSLMVGRMPMSIVFTIPTLFILGYIMSGMMQIAIRQVKGEYVAAGDIFRGWPVVLRIMGVNLLLGAASWAILSPIYFLFFDKYHANPPTAGLIVLGVVYIVGLLLIAVMNSCLMPAYVLVADGERVFRAIARSYNAIKNDGIRAFFLYFVYGIITFISTLPCLIGLIVTVPMGMLMLALVYRDMLGMPAPIPLQYEYGQQSEGSWPPPPSL